MHILKQSRAFLRKRTTFRGEISLSIDLSIPLPPSPSCQPPLDPAPSSYPHPSLWWWRCGHPVVAPKRQHVFTPHISTLITSRTAQSMMRKHASRYDAADRPSERLPNPQSPEHRTGSFHVFTRQVERWMRPEVLWCCPSIPRVSHEWQPSNL